MPIYDRPTKVLMQEWVEAHATPGRSFHKSEIVDWFSHHYPKIRPGTVTMHVEAMATNNGRLRQHHPSVRQGSGHDLFFKMEDGRFRLFDPATDPAPVYDAASAQALREAGASDPEDEAALPDTATIARVTQFAYERDLQNYLAKNLAAIEPGLRLYRDPEEETVNGFEYDVGGRRIDILAQDADDNLVVIELKVAKGYDRVVGQIARYIAWVRENLAEGRLVRGIIVASEISEDLKLATSIVPGIELIEYEMRFEVRRIGNRSGDNRD